MLQAMMMNHLVWEVTIDAIWIMTAPLIAQRFTTPYAQIGPPNVSLELFTTPAPSVLAAVFLLLLRRLNHLHLNKTSYNIKYPFIHLLCALSALGFC